MNEGQRLPYTLAIHRGGPDEENPHAHLMISERANDEIERSREQWFRRYNAKAPEGGAKKSRTMMSREWVKDTREAERSGDLEQAAELSRKPNVHLGPQAYRAGDLEREAHDLRRCLRSPRPCDLLACQLAFETGRSWPGVYNNVRLDRR